MKRLLLLAILLLVLATCAGCGGRNGQDPVEAKPEKVQVVVSILPQAEFVNRIGKDKVQVEVMIPPGASPATYDPTPGRLRRLSEAQMYVRIGHVPFEKAWMDKIKSVNRDMKIIDSSAGINIVEKDPHIWLSPPLVKQQAKHIYKGLAAVDPENKEFYARNREEFIRDLDRLDQDIKDTLPGVEGKKFMVFHPSWGYFAREYGLVQVPVEIEGKEPSAADLAGLVKKARENNIKAIFVSPQVSDKSAKVIAAETGGEVIYADPLAGDYFKNMRSVAEKFARVLN